MINQVRHGSSTMQVTPVKQYIPLLPESMPLPVHSIALTMFAFWTELPKPRWHAVVLVHERESASPSLGWHAGCSFTIYIYLRLTVLSHFASLLVPQLVPKGQSSAGEDSPHMQPLRFIHLGLASEPTASVNCNNNGNL